MSSEANWTETPWGNDFIDRVAAASDIVHVIASYIPVMRVGANWRATCPFHRETTSSFYMSPQKQAYYCFGCGAGGSVFKFVMEYARVDFETAVHRLAAYNNVPKLLPWRADDAGETFRVRSIPGVNAGQIRDAHDAAQAARRTEIAQGGGHD